MAVWLEYLYFELGIIEYIQIPNMDLISLEPVTHICMLLTAYILAVLP